MVILLGEMVPECPNGYATYSGVNAEVGERDGRGNEPRGAGWADEQIVSDVSEVPACRPSVPRHPVRRPARLLSFPLS